MIGGRERSAPFRESDSNMTPSSLHEVGRVDPEVALGLERQVCEGFAKEAVAQFLKHTPELIAALRAALETGSCRGVENEAHKLAPNAASIGAMALAELAGRLELSAKQHAPLPQLAELVARVEREFDEVRPWIESLPSRPPRPVVAVVEDNEDNLLLVRVLLRRRYEVREYRSARETLDGLHARHPDVVLMDIYLPGMDGIDLLRELRARGFPADVPVIALTAHAMAGDRQRLVAAGFDDYVSKPIVDKRLLFDAIELQLGRARARPRR
jgi:CheY-like chemotaxis protein